MKHTLINTSTLDALPEYKMFKGIPWSISVKEQNGYWYSKWQVTCHYPSPTGDASDWCSFDIGCLNREQAVLVAKEYANRLGIPGDRVKIQNSNGSYDTLSGEEYMGRID